MIRNTSGRRIGWAGAALALALAGAAWWGWLGASGTAEVEVEESPGLVVAVVRAEAAGPWRRAYRFAGRVEPVRRAELGYEQGGLVAEVVVEEGDAVEAGAVVARLDTARWEARRAELVAAVAEAEAGAVLAETTRRRQEEVFAAEATSRQRVDEARQDAVIREALAERWRAQLAALDLDIARASLVAPFAGVVAARYVDAGTVVGPGQPVVRLLGRDELDARVGVRADLAARLEVGEPVTLEGEGWTATGRVRAVLPDREASSRLVPVLIAVPVEVAGRCRSGDLVRAVLTAEQAAEGFWLPRSALLPGARGAWTCLVVEEREAGYRAAARPVEVAWTDGERVLVRGGLAAGEAVVADGVHRLVAGQRVRLGGEGAR